MMDTKIKPLDLSNLIRDAFLSGRGLKPDVPGGVAKLSEADQAAWMEYDPTQLACYQRIEAALTPPPTEEALVDRAAFAIACTMAEQDGVLLTFDGYQHGAKVRAHEHKRFLAAVAKGVAVVLRSKL